MNDKDFEYEPQKKSGGKGGLITAVVILSVIVILLLALVVFLSNRGRVGFGSREELESAGASCIAESIKELEDIILKYD